MRAICLFAGADCRAKAGGMIILLSPAKSLDFSSDLPQGPLSAARLEERTRILAEALARKSKPALKKIMPVSDSLVALNHDRYRSFFDQPERPAIRAYAGDVYIGFEAATLDEAALDFAQDHVRILSGLYGLLRPFDAIRPHRLEMGTRWAPRHKKLTDFWGTRIADLLHEDISVAGNPLIVNLASQEYYASILPHEKRLGARIIHVDFRNAGPDGPKFVSFDAKRARGMMARWLCEHRHSDAEALTGFDSDGYRIAADHSSDDRLTFIRS